MAFLGYTLLFFSSRAPSSWNVDPEYTIDVQYGYTLDGSFMLIYDGYTYLVGGLNPSEKH